MAGRTEDGSWCLENADDPGFAVLWADDHASARLREQRATLSRRLAHALVAAGFLPYDGNDYLGLYEADAEAPGSFIDRHVPGQRIFFLRQPRVPSVIIETHHGLDPDETSRWREEATREAFARAVAAGLS